MTSERSCELTWQLLTPEKLFAKFPIPSLTRNFVSISCAVKFENVTFYKQSKIKDLNKIGSIFHFECFTTHLGSLRVFFHLLGLFFRLGKEHRCRLLWRVLGSLDLVGKRDKSSQFFCFCFGLSSLPLYTFSFMFWISSTQCKFIIRPFLESFGFSK